MRSQKMKKYLIFVLLLIILSSCIFNPFQNDGFSNRTYYYQPYDTLKVYFDLSLTEVNITFKDSFPEISFADSVLNKYAFITLDSMLFARYHYKSGFRAFINNKCTDNGFKNYLKELNSDIEISAATPIFYTDKDDPMSYMILVNRIYTKNNPDIIDDLGFKEYCESKGLERIPSTPYRSSYYIVKNVVSGFEPLFIANEICVNDTSEYANPDFYINLYR
jgi:hypothetical protein